MKPINLFNFWISQMTSQKAEQVILCVRKANTFDALDKFESFAKLKKSSMDNTFIVAKAE